jgi:hypothetical protein
MSHTQRLLSGGLLGLAMVGMAGATVLATDPPPPPTGCASITLPEPTNPNKVVLCHFTSSGSNPFVVNEVSDSAAETHFGHHGDCVNPPGDSNTVCF